MKLFRLTVCDFMVYKYKDYKINLKSALPKHGINFRSPTPHLFSDQSSCHQPSQYLFEVPPKRVSPPYHPSTFDHTLFIDGLLLSKFIQARHTDGGIWAKNNLLVLFDGVLMASSSSSFVFMQFRWGIFNFFASFYSDVLFIYY